MIDHSYLYYIAEIEICWNLGPARVAFFMGSIDMSFVVIHSGHEHLLRDTRWPPSFETERKYALTSSWMGKHRTHKKKLCRSLPLEETTLHTPRSWVTPFQRNLSSSSSLPQATFPLAVNLKSHKGLSHITKVCRRYHNRSRKSPRLERKTIQIFIKPCIAWLLLNVLAYF